MPIFKALFIAHGPSGLPEDNIVNTFHFEVGSGADVDAAKLGVVNIVQDFYNGTAATTVGDVTVSAQSNAVASYLSDWVQRPAEVRVYNLDDAKPRVPFTDEFTLATSIGANGLPEEVSCCLSYQGIPPHTPRRRGRMYIGPLASGAVIASSHTAAARPESTFVNDLLRAARRLSIPPGGEVIWSILSSRPSLNTVTIAEGYVDNALDTQIRRGPTASSRMSFSTLLGLTGSA